MYGLWWVVIAITAISIITGFWIEKKAGFDGVMPIIIVSFFIDIMVTIAAIIVPINGKTEFVQKQYEYEALATVAIEYDDFIQTKQFELVSKEIVDRILDYNAWLAEARADKETRGAFSRYIYCDLDSLKFIGE